jgi:peptidoglycan hydrolase-like protein with peptidoglycan-binding domain
MFDSTRHILFVLSSFLLVTLSVAVLNVKAAPFSGEEVREVQQGLLDIGYWPGPIDGIMGPRTRAALRRYQQDENLPVTGRLDLGTARKVKEARHTRDSDQMKFHGMDANNDGVITRQEYPGDDRSFANHDWNGDGVLSGEEVRPGARRPDLHANRPDLPAREGSASGDFKGAGREMGRGSKEGAHEMKEGKPVASGKEFGKGVGRFGKKVGEGAKKAVSTESDRGNREKK